MPNPTPLPANKTHPDFNSELGLSPRPNSDPPGAPTEVENLLIRFNPRLIGFGIVGPSSDLCLGMGAPRQVGLVATHADSGPEGQQ